MTLEPTTRNAFVLLAAIGVLACDTACGIRSAPRPGAACSTAATDVVMNSLRVSSPTVKAGERVTATVTLTGPARAASGAVTVYVGFDSDVLTGPREVRIPNGQTSATFRLYSKPFLRAPRSGAISACTLSPEPYRLLTSSVSIIPGAVSPTTTAPLGRGRG